MGFDTNRLCQFIVGVGSVLDIMPVPRRPDWPLIRISDAEAIGGDWAAVGDDLRIATASCQPPP